MASRGGMGGGFGGGGFGGMGGVMQQQRALRYLRAGGPRDLRKTFARVRTYLGRYKLHLIVGTALLLSGVALGLIPPLLIRALIDTAIPDRDMHLAILLGLGLFLAPLGAAVLNLGQSYLATRVAQGMIADLREHLYRHVQALGLDFFTWTRAGEIHTRFLNDAGNLQSVLTQSFLGTIANLVTVVATLTVMAVIDWRLALIAALALPAFALPVLHFGKRRYLAVERAQAALGELSIVLEETLSLSGAIVVKTFGTEDREKARFDEVNDDVRREQITQILEGQWLSLVVQGLATLGPAVLYGYGAWLVITGQVQLGTLVAFATYLAQLYSPASSLAGANATLLGGLALFDRVFEVLDVPVRVKEPTAPTPLPAVPTEGLVFDEVDFAYPVSDGEAGGIEVLHGISFAARPGQLVALVGPSGAGKSTILSLAARLYDPDDGVIRLDGVPLPEIGRKDLREHVAVVTQEVFLFHATLRENICYGVPDAGAEAVARAVAAAQLGDLVARLPEGIDTVVGERGYRLSGGEKQRVAIARALLRQAPYLLLDEATSSLDSEVERRIQRALERLIQGRTTIAIAHRLSTIQRADQILVVDDGRIVERGTHEELLERSGRYRQLYLAQFASEAEAPAGAAEGVPAREMEPVARG
ncbi:MAG TPA: ABC transporter ATP-binding protein [Thermomicrobiaceae bacterium]|nr:ABC transporter ATP-binding protein [Thermomicrobiaceae bacterium]